MNWEAKQFRGMSTLHLGVSLPVLLDRLVLVGF